MHYLRLDQVNRFLLGKQHLAPETKGSDILDVVNDICALHATGATSPYLSLWSRMSTFQREQLDTELYERQRLTRLICMRSTMHIVVSQQLPVFFQATRERLQRGFLRLAGRLLVQAGLCQEGGETEALERLQQQILDVLAGQWPCTVSELSEQVPELAARLKYSPTQPYEGGFSLGSRLVPGMCVLGHLARARPRGTWRSNLHRYAPLALWLPDVDLDAIAPDEAQVCLIRQYLAALGPSTVEDIAWWSGFSKTEIVRALSLLGQDVARCGIEGLGENHVMLAENLQRVADTEVGSESIVNLLPVLDPYIMGYKDRRRFLDPEHYHQAFDRSGNAFNTV